MADAVFVIGAARTDFKRNFRKEGKGLRDMIVEAGRSAIDDAKIEPGDVQSGVLGNFAAGLFTRQLHLGAFLPEIDESLRGIPTLHTEAACASGGVGVLTAAHQIMGGIHDVVIVVGAEQQKTMSPTEGSDVLGAAADYHVEKAAYGEFMFPKLFARIAQLYQQKFELTDRQLALVAAKNYAHARLNPLAQMRDSKLTLEQCETESAENRVIASPLKLADCSQITDGAAAIVLCSQRFLDKLRGQSRRPAIRMLGYGHTTDYLPLDRKQVPEMPIAKNGARRAFAMASLSPRDLNGVEVHDCFSISEVLACEVLGLAETGQAPRLIETGATMLPQVRSELGVGKPVMSIPVNAGGGLLADGHPVGATGVRQIVEAFQQLSGTAGKRQIDGARRYACFNMGGSMTTAVTTLWGTES